MKRVIFDIILFISIFVFPWWVTVPLAFIGIFIFAQFYEFMVAGIVIYSVYAIPSSRIIASPIWFPLVLSLVFIGIQVLRGKIILYKNEIPY